jgi:hypothetical protein
MSGPHAAIVLQAIALSKTYRMGDVEVRALRGVDLALFEGEFMVLVGPAEFLTTIGIDSISLNPDSLVAVATRLAS